jgi:hypothetical protein
MRPLPNPAAGAALRRFAALWTVSVAVKVAALAVLLLLAWKLLGGF